MLLIYKNIKLFCSEIGHPLKSYLKKINELGTGFLILTNSGIFVSVITDGDIRRMILENVNIDQEYYPTDNISIYVKTSDSYEYLLKKYYFHELQVLPVLDNNMKIKIIATDISYISFENNCNGFIMAGGQGLRLQPITLQTPKPLLQIAGKPLIEYAIDYIKKTGISIIEVSVNYKKEMIINYLKTKTTEELTLLPIVETNKLGTAGSLKLTEFKNNDLLVCNADIITELDFNKIIWTALVNKFDVVVCTRHFTNEIPFGVIEKDKKTIIKINEKPKFNYNVVAGIYFISAKVIKLIKNYNHIDMPELINLAIEKKYKVGCLEITEDWIDIGQPEQFDKAVKKYE